MDLATIYQDLHAKRLVLTASTDRHQLSSAPVAILDALLALDLL